MLAGVRLRWGRRRRTLSTASPAGSLRASATHSGRPPREVQALLQGFTRLFPLWAVLAAAVGTRCPAACAHLGSPATFARGLALLMVSLGVTLTPADMARAMQSPLALGLNALLCFGVMPVAGWAVGALLQCTTQTRVGLVLLGSVSGGQASNLCALLARGDVALSVVLTASTTLLGVFATPVLVHLFVGSVVPMDTLGILRTTVSIVLAPLFTGLFLGRFFPNVAARLVPWCPAVGVLATLLLVTGGAANSAVLLVGAGRCWEAHVGSVLLPLAGGFVAFAAARACRLRERAVRTLTLETLVKSPTLAYMLAQRHFEPGVAVVPAAAMVWLAALGATAATLWARHAPAPDM